MKAMFLQFIQQHEDIIFGTVYLIIVVALTLLMAMYVGTVDDLPGWL